jgi:hypothetical protein
MAKQPIPVRQDISTVVGGPRQNGQLDIGAMTDAIPALPAFNPAAIVAKLKVLNDQGDRVLGGAERMNITSAENAATATDFLATITKRIGEVDEERKSVTGNFDKLVKGLNALFTTGPTAKLSKAKVLVSGKLGAWVLSERARLEREAEEARQQAAAEAAAQAQTAVEEGDTEGALEILETAANIEFKVDKPVVRGASGATLSQTKRKVGKVTDLRKFIAWAGSSDTPMALAVVGGIEVGQKELNQLAAAVVKVNEARIASGEAALVIPGFEAGFAESFNARG